MSELKPLTDLKVWAERYGISLTPSECLNCKKKYPFTTPIALSGYRGVEQEVHECGEKYAQFRCVPIDNDKIELWNSILESKELKGGADE